MKKIIRKTWRALAGRPSCRMVNQLMFDCALNGLGILNYENSRVSGERHFVAKVLPLYISEDSPLMIDVGANRGSYTQLLRKFHPNASFMAFEPNPRTFRQLKSEFAGSNVRIINKGLGSGESVMKFYDRKDHDGSSAHGSLYREVIEDLHKEEAVELEVNIIRLDDYAEENHIKKVKLLKIDTEGHELEVLKGGRVLLERGGVDLLHIEFNEMNIISRVFFRDIARALPNHIPYRLLPGGAIQLRETPLQTELFAYQNLVFVHKRFKPDKAMRPGV